MASEVNARRVFSRKGMDMTGLTRRSFLQVAGLAGGVLILPGRGFSQGKAQIEFKAAVSGSASNMGYCQFYIPDKLGFYAEEGIKIQRVDFAGGGETVRGLIDGRMGIGGTSFTAVVQAFQRDFKVKILGSGFATGVIDWLVRSDSPVTGLKDIKGRKLGYTRPGSNTHYQALVAVSAAGLKPEDVQLVSVGDLAAAWTALKTGIVDVSPSGEALTTLRLESKEARVVWRSPDIIPHWMEQALITTESFAREEPDLLRAFMRAHLKGLDYIRDNTAEAGRIWARMVNFRDVELAARAITNWPKSAWTAKMSVEALREIEKSMRVMQQAEKPVDWKGLIDQSFLPPSLRISLPS
jgi:NitT/TauT family transport system substrate-binding protein